ncbi:MAG: hypothetical protein K2H75_00890 [Muribaculaceae bacterium]|nr:hypothetical protein [Muribaculaceae bacterium]
MFKLIKRTLVALLALLGIGSVRGETQQDPRQLTIYQVMVASFQHAEDGAPGYTAMWGPEGHRKNGNIKGVTAALDHIKALGANAIWLTPIFDSTSAGGGEKLQATGYFTNNFFAVDPNFGTEDDLRELVREAHARGMYVILDGVFGHHGGVTDPSPSGYTLDVEWVDSDRGPEGGQGNIRYPGSLDYIKEVATYWIDNFDIDGWRLDQAYQATQNGVNYWNEIRGAVEELTAKRRKDGERWGTLGYMVGEDWGTADVINRGVYRDGGLLSAFDFDGKELISGPMQDPSQPGLANGWDDIVTIYSVPTLRGYLNDSVMPNLYLSNHDGYRLADHFADDDADRWRQMKLRHAILAGYSGPITLYYGDEYGDLSRDTEGGQKDNIARTTGHLEPRTPEEADLRDYVAYIMTLRQNNPALWRGTSNFARISSPDGPDILQVTKTDPETGNSVLIIFSDSDTDVETPVGTVHVERLVPRFVLLK